MLNCWQGRSLWRTSTPATFQLLCSMACLGDWGCSSSCFSNIHFHYSTTLLDGLLGGAVAPAFQISTFTFLIFHFDFSTTLLNVLLGGAVAPAFQRSTFTFQLLCSIACLGAMSPTFQLSTTEQFVDIIIVSFISSKCYFILQ